MLRKKEVIDAVGVAKSTASDWINEYAAFIPSTQEGAVVYYRSEAVDVLKVIKELRETGQTKQQIMEALARRFPFTIDEKTIVDPVGESTAIARFIEQYEGLEAKMDEQSAQISALVELNRELVKRLDNREEYEKKRDDQVIEMLAAIRKQKKAVRQLAIASEQKRSLWQKLFGK